MCTYVCSGGCKISRKGGRQPLNFGEKKNYLLFDKIFPEMKEIGPSGGRGGKGWGSAGGIPSAPMYLDIQLLSELFSKGFSL